jgi:hypothetical protein
VSKIALGTFGSNALGHDDPARQRRPEPEVTADDLDTGRAELGRREAALARAARDAAKPPSLWARLMG